jgi:hypothetical protein
MRIVATHAICLLEWLVVMRFLQVSALHVMAINTQRRWSFGQVIIELWLPNFARFVRGVASVAAHIEGRMSAAFLRNIYAGVVAAQAEVLFLVPRLWLQQLKLVVRLVRVVTLHAVAHGRRMNRTLYVVGILVRVAGQTEGMGSCRDQLYPGDIFRSANLVATGAAHGNRGMN